LFTFENPSCERRVTLCPMFGNRNKPNDDERRDLQLRQIGNDEMRKNKLQQEVKERTKT